MIDLGKEALARVLRREIPWRQHCHRADDILTAVRLADEFGYDLVIDHGTEAHLVADVLVERGIPVLLGPLIVGRGKVELRNRAFRNARLLAEAGIELSLVTDHPVIPANLLHVQAAYAVREGLDREVALRAITLNPARALGVSDRIGSLVEGKDADLCIWSGDPLDPMQRVENAYIRGQEVFHWNNSQQTGTINGREWWAEVGCFGGAIVGARLRAAGVCWEGAAIQEQLTRVVTLHQSGRGSGLWMTGGGVCDRWRDTTRQR